MGAPRKYPPANILEVIEQYVACEGGATAILGRAMGVSDSTVRRWLDEDEKLKDAYDGAREAYMHKLYLELIQMARIGKGNVAGIIYALKSKFKMYDMPNKNDTVNVGVQVEVPAVMVVRDHGTDEEWAAKVAAQQRKLIEASGTPSPTINALAAPKIEAFQPCLAPTAPAWKPRAK